MWDRRVVLVVVVVNGVAKVRVLCCSRCLVFSRVFLGIVEGLMRCWDSVRACNVLSWSCGVSTFFLLRCGRQWLVEGPLCRRRCTWLIRETWTKTDFHARRGMNGVEQETDSSLCWAVMPMPLETIISLPKEVWSGFQARRGMNWVTQDADLSLLRLDSNYNDLKI